MSIHSLALKPDDYQVMLNNRYMRVACLLLLAAIFAIPTQAEAQRLYLSGGAYLANEPLISDVAGTNPSVRLGAMFDASDYGRVQIGGALQGLYAAEGVFQLHVRGADKQVSPYLYAGYGYFINGDSERGTVPAGIGVQYAVDENIGISAEVGGRFVTVLATSEQPARANTEVISGLAPSLGVTYKLNRIDRRPPGETPVEEETSAAESGGNFPGRAPGETVSSPFEDPMSTSMAGEPPPQYERPSLDSLKQADPIIIRRGEPTPFDDPGVPPISGEVVVSENGDMVRLPDGTFIMGLTDEDPYNLQSAGRKRITVSSFYIDRLEVTNSEYREWLNTLSGQEREENLPDSVAFREGASRGNFQTYFYGSTYQEYPAVAVTWDEARKYCEWDGKRLPTEAEWEYAARSGRVGGVYPWSGFSTQNNYGQYLANFNPGRQGQAADGYAFTAPVGSYPLSRWGLWDMAGNAAEWVQDAYKPTYSDLSGLDPMYSDPEEDDRVVRGGSWDSGELEIGVGYRDRQSKDQPSPRIGFRCAADVSQIEGTMQRFDRPQGQQPPGQQPPPQQGQQPPPEGGQQPPEGGQQPPQQGQQPPPPGGGQQQDPPPSGGGGGQGGGGQ
mgnify:CR=1 FL=1